MNKHDFLENSLKKITQKIGKRENDWLGASVFFSDYLLAYTLEEYGKLDSTGINYTGMLVIRTNTSQKRAQAIEAIKAIRNKADISIKEYIRTLLESDKTPEDLSSEDDIKKFEEFAREKAKKIANNIYLSFPKEAGELFPSLGFSNSEFYNLEIATLLDYYCRNAELLVAKENANDPKLTRCSFFDKALDFFVEVYKNWDTEFSNSPKLLKENILKALYDNDSTKLPDTEFFNLLYETLYLFTKKLKLIVEKKDNTYSIKTDSGSVKASQKKRCTEFEATTYNMVFVNHIATSWNNPKSRKAYCRLGESIETITAGMGAEYSKSDCFEKIITLMIAVHKTLMSNIQEKNSPIPYILLIWHLLQNNIIFQAYYWHTLLEVISLTQKRNKLLKTLEEKPFIFKPSFHKTLYLKNILNAINHYIGDNTKLNSFDIVEHFEEYSDSLNNIQKENIDISLDEISDACSEIKKYIPRLFNNQNNFLDKQIDIVCEKNKKEKHSKYAKQFNDIWKYYFLLNRTTAGIKPQTSIKNLIYKIKKERKNDREHVFHSM